MSDFYRPLPFVNIIKADKKLDYEREGGIRLYCTQAGTAWALQVRDWIRLANGRKGKDFIIATASMSREDLLALRTAIDETLAEYGVVEGEG